MNKEMAPDLLKKLPKWAQEYIRYVEIEREMAIRTLNEFQDTQTESRIWIEEPVCTGEQSGPTTKRNYIQNYKVHFKLGAGDIEVRHDFREPEQTIYITAPRGIVFHPISYNQIAITEEP